MCPITLSPEKVPYITESLKFKEEVSFCLNLICPTVTFSIGLPTLFLLSPASSWSLSLQLVRMRLYFLSLTLEPESPHTWSQFLWPGSMPINFGFQFLFFQCFRLWLLAWKGLKALFKAQGWQENLLPCLHSLVHTCWALRRLVKFNQGWLFLVSFWVLKVVLTRLGCASFSESVHLSLMSQDTISSAGFQLKDNPQSAWQTYKVKIHSYTTDNLWMEFPVLKAGQKQDNDY